MRDYFDVFFFRVFFTDVYRVPRGWSISRTSQKTPINKSAPGGLSMTRVIASGDPRQLSRFNPSTLLDALLILNILVLHALSYLTDDQTEDQIRNRPCRNGSMCQFEGRFSSTDIPDQPLVRQIDRSDMLPMFCPQGSQCADEWSAPPS